MDKEVQDALIRKCKQVVEDTYPIGDPIKMADIHDLLLKKGIPFNILCKAYHAQEGQYLFYDKSVLLSQLLLMITMSTERAERHPDAKDSVLNHIRKRIDLRCFRVNKDTGYIDVYKYDTGVVLFERRNPNDKNAKIEPRCFNCKWYRDYTKWCCFCNITIEGRANPCAMWESDSYEKEEKE